MTSTLDIQHKHGKQNCHAYAVVIIVDIVRQNFYLLPVEGRLKG